MFISEVKVTEKENNREASRNERSYVYYVIVIVYIAQQNIIIRDYNQSNHR